MDGFTLGLAAQRVVVNLLSGEGGSAEGNDVRDSLAWPRAGPSRLAASSAYRCVY